MLEAIQLKKSFGNTQAVVDVSFDVHPGEIMGMIGRNGSGKTTIFRMILGFLTPENQGQILWNHQPIKQQIYSLVGYLPEERGLYDKLSIESHIRYFAELRGMPWSEIDPKINYWFDRFQVKGNRKDKIKSLSKGNQQKIQLITSLIHEPKLLILDEPFSGLDPVNADLLKDGILELKDQGSAIIFSSHNMNNVEELCDRLIMIHEGERVLYGEVQAVRQSFGRIHLTVETTAWTLEDFAAFEGVEGIEEVQAHTYQMKLAKPSVGEAIYQALTAQTYVPIFNQQAPSLEDIFKMKAGEQDE